MKSKRTWLRTFILLTFPALLLIVVPSAVSYWKRSLTIDDGVGGGWKKDAAGERATLSGILFDVQRNTETNVFKSAYRVAESDGKYMKAVALGRFPYREWVYDLEYNRQEKILTKRLFKNNTYPNNADKVWVWHNVSEDAIHQVAAPVLKLKTTFEVEAYKGGNLSDLKKYGATMEEVK